MTKIAVRRALISVYDKTGLEDLARGLHDAGVEIVSTGSTAARIRDLGIPVTAVDEVTGFPEILGGRVKTLHPHVHAGLLADQNDPEHVATIEELGIAPFQLLVSNLYPFADTVASGASQPEVVEQIDIGGPAMVRASAKNHGSIAVVTDPSYYGSALEAVRAGGFELTQRQALAVAAFRHTARYDIAVASWLGSVVAPDDEVDGEASGFPGWLAASYERAEVLRYGENPHQRAALYVAHHGRPGVAQADQLHGKEMSYNNYVDTDAAWRAAYDFTDPCVAIIKHANPCGIAVGEDIAQAHRKAHACDPTSAFGGVIATNRPVTLTMAEQLADIFSRAQRRRHGACLAARVDPLGHVRRRGAHRCRLEHRRAAPPAHTPDPRRRRGCRRLHGHRSGIGGPPIALVYQRADGPTLRATLSRFFLAGAAVSIPTLLVAGVLDGDSVLPALVLLPGTTLGFLLSGRLPAASTRATLARWSSGCRRSPPSR